MSLPNTPSFVAGGTIAPGRAVKISTAADNTVLQGAAATDPCFGIAKRSMRDAPGLTGSDNAVAANAGEACEVYGPGSVAPAIAGAAITRGARVSSDANGKVITAVSTSWILGWALESAAGDGSEIQVFVHPMQIMA